MGLVELNALLQNESMPTCRRCVLDAGEDRDAEETVLTDRSAGSAREGEFPEREKQSAHHASEGKNILLSAGVVNIRSDLPNDVFCCLQEREKLTSLEEKYAELSEGQAFTSNPLTITEVRRVAKLSVLPREHFEFLLIPPISYSICSR